MKYDRYELIEICEKAIVDQDNWVDRDSPSTQKQIGECWALLKAGCSYRIITKEIDMGWHTDEKTIVLEITYSGFSDFENNTFPSEVETYYLPTKHTLDKHDGEDWY